ncbi:MAG: hypothetical protein HPY57_15090 [Ignavibacteria bacterium]|nr:hypothetical protein [Ignavibacteria bacterium]
MKETEFKALMHCGQYVDANLLEKGIYPCSIPFIYSKDETIENIVERGRMMKDMTGSNFISEKYFDNLKQCQLVPNFNYGVTSVEEWLQLVLM